MITINLLVSSRYLVGRKMLRERAISFLQAHRLDAVIVDVHIVGRTKIKMLNEQIGHRRRQQRSPAVIVLCVDVRSAFQQDGCDTWIRIVQRRMYQCRTVVFVLCIDVGPGIQQSRYDSRIRVIGRRAHQRRLSFLIPLIDVQPGLKQHRRDVPVRVGGSPPQCSPAVLVPCAKVRSGPQ